MLEAEKVADYLRSRLPQASEVTVENVFRIPGGASRETWSFDARWREGGAEVSQAFVLRRDPDASLLESDRDTEFRVMDAVWSQGVPVPRMHWLEPDPAWLERPFFVMERVDGCEVSPQKLLFERRFISVHPPIAQKFVDILARIHALDWRQLGLSAIGGLSVPKEPGACALMEIEKWEAVVDKDALEPQPVLRAAFRWLRRNLPPPAQRIVLVHADYRTGNFLFNESGEIKAFLDWEMTHLGDPLEDVGWACMRPWRWAGDERIGGLMGRDEFYRMYEEATGLKVDPQAVHFWELLGNVKFAAINITGARSFCDGRTRSIMIALVGRNMKRMELEIMDLMGV
ncbi:MAG: phosphotransferase family protein [Dehalococcoidia bacterium]|nr:MAG: phosphotransferase family protein [Dehalococcoidia bacterium]